MAAKNTSTSLFGASSGSSSGGGEGRADTGGGGGGGKAPVVFSTMYNPLNTAASQV